MSSPAPRYSPRLDEAVALAVADFRHHVRKGTSIPYITHLFSVMSLVGEYGGDEDQLIAAVLHDWLEDVKGAHPQFLEDRFGPRVRRLVLGLTDTMEHPKPPWRARKEAYLAHLGSEPAELKLISAADKLHNCQTIRMDLAAIGDAVWQRFSGGKDGSLWYYQQVAIAIAHDWDHPLSRRLTREVGAMTAEANRAAEAGS